MIRLIDTRCFLVALAALFVTPGFVPADDNLYSEVSYPQDSAYADSMESRLMQLESEIADLQMSRATVTQNRSQCHCQSRSGLEAGYAFFFAKPQMKESFQATVVDVAANSMSMVPFSFDYDLTPRVWLGYFNENGVGIRARYWQYDHNANPLNLTAGLTTYPGSSSVTVIFPAAISTAFPGDTLTVASGLNVHTVDVEGAIRRNLVGIDLLASAGFRYASVDQTYNAIVNRGAAVLGSLDWNREFEGGGLTVGADASKTLGGSRLSALASARGSLLYGEKTLTRNVVGDITPPASAVPPLVSLQDADEVSGIFELSAGLEWNHPTKRFGNFFVRGMYETQLWTAAGAPTLTFLGFDGLSLSIGLQR